MDRTDPRLIELIFAVLSYIDVKSTIDQRNPLMKSFGDVETSSKDLQDSFAYLVETVNNLQDYYPQIEEILSEIEDKNQVPEGTALLDNSN